MTYEQLTEKKRGLEVQRDNAIAQVNFALGALALVNELLAEMETATQSADVEGEKDNKDA